MKQILLLLIVILFLFLSLEILLQVNYCVLLTFNKMNDKNVIVYKERRKYKLMILETFKNINNYIQNKSLKMIK